MTNCLILVVALAAVPVVAVLVPVRAECEDAADPVADKHAKIQFEEGVRMYKEGDFDGAAIAFERAFELRPSYKILYNVGQVESELKHYSRACEAYQKYLDEGGVEIDDERTTEVKAIIERLQMLVGYLALQYSKDGVTVMIDGERRGTTPLAAPLVVDMGTHALSLRDGITEVYKESVRIGGGQTLTLSLESDAAPTSINSDILEPTAGPVRETASTTPDVVKPAPPAVAPKVEKKRKVTWIVGGFAAAVGVAGGILGGIAMGKESALVEKCDNAVCDSGLKGEADAISAMNLTADILYGTAGAAAVAAIVLFFVEPKRNKERAVALSPLIMPSLIGMEGRF